MVNIMVENLKKCMIMIQHMLIIYLWMDHIVINLLNYFINIVLREKNSLIKLLKKKKNK